MRKAKKRFFEKPIFDQDMPGNLEDNWTGFVIGGMAQYGELQVARAYKSAADLVVAKALKSSDLSHEWAFPVLYLYRHVIELYLKLIVRPTKPTHGLMKLARQFRHIVQSKLKLAVPDWVMDRLRELAEMDPHSATFRYTRKKDGKHNWLPGEFWVSFRHLRKVVNVLVKGFEQAHFALGRSERF